MKYCTQCGHQNSDTAKFCIACGTKFELPAALESAPRSNPPPLAPVVVVPTPAPKPDKVVVLEIPRQQNPGLVPAVQSASTRPTADAPSLHRDEARPHQMATPQQAEAGQQPISLPASRLPAATLFSAKNYFYLNEQNEAIGPHTSEELGDLARRGIITSMTLIAADGDQEWKPWQEISPASGESILQSNNPVAANSATPAQKTQTAPPTGAANFRRQWQAAFLSVGSTIHLAMVAANIGVSFGGIRTGLTAGELPSLMLACSCGIFGLRLYFKGKNYKTVCWLNSILLLLLALGILVFLFDDSMKGAKDIVTAILIFAALIPTMCLIGASGFKTKV